MHYLDYGLARIRREEDIRSGLVALVKAYYHEYTDATNLEPGFVAALSSVWDWTGQPLDVDLEQVITDAETQINLDGGIASDTDGRRHLVGPTFPDYVDGGGPD